MEQDKLNFAKNCKRAEIGFKNRKKILKDSAIAFIFPSIFAIILSITFPIALTVLMVEVLLYGTYTTYAHLCNCDDIKKCNVRTTNFTYKDYKKMKKTGELDKLYQQIEEIEKQEANEMYSQYLEFCKGKSYTSVKIDSNGKIEELETNNDKKINDNL